MVYIEKGFPSKEIDEIAWSESNSRKPIYHMHKWFARRVGSTFRTIMLGIFHDEDPMNRFYEDVALENINGEPPILLDPFMGGGTTIVEGHRLGCRTIGVDINPMAWFITRKELESVDITNVEEAFDKIKESVESRILSFYKTTCAKGHQADIMYTFWVRSINCLSCGNEVSLFKSFLISKRESKLKTFFCPSCDDIVITDKSQCHCGIDLSTGHATNKSYTCPSCKHTGDLTEAWLAGNKPPIERPYALEIYCRDCGREYKIPDEADLKRVADVDRDYNLRKNNLVGTLIPDDEVPWNKMATMRPRCAIYRKFSDFFNSRQLLALSMILEQILQVDERAVREFFLLTFSDSLNANNMFCIYNTHASKLEPLFGGHYFSPPTTPVENNVWGTKVGRGSFSRYVAKGIRALKYQRMPYEIRFKDGGIEGGKQIRIRERVNVGGEINAQFVKDFNDLKQRTATLLRCQSSEELGFIPDKAIDAVVTDPPYFDNIMYSELSDFFYVWLRDQLKDAYPFSFGRESSKSADEILVYNKRGKDAEFFVESMTRVYSELYRVLKDDAKLVFVYQHKRLKAWTAILRILVNTGFHVEAVYPTHGETPSGVRAHGINHNVILVCRKKKSESTSFSKMKSRSAAKDGIHSVRNEKSSLMIELGKALQVYTEHSILKDGIIASECVKDFESFVQDAILNPK
ncbi:MAG: DNA methyltransferase [Candidatus Thorarchaeota archaeon]